MWVGGDLGGVCVCVCVCVCVFTQIFENTKLFWEKDWVFFNIFCIYTYFSWGIPAFAGMTVFFFVGMTTLGFAKIRKII